VKVLFNGGMPCTATAFESSIFGVIFMVSCVCQFAMMIPINIFLLYKSFKVLHDRRGDMSEKTARMHRNLLLSLVAQMIVPFATLFLPFSICAVFVAFEVENVACECPFLVA